MSKSGDRVQQLFHAVNLDCPGLLEKGFHILSFPASEPVWLAAALAPPEVSPPFKIMIGFLAASFLIVSNKHGRFLGLPYKQRRLWYVNLPGNIGPYHIR